MAKSRYHDFIIFTSGPVFAFNRFAAKVDVFGKRYDTFVDEFSSILGRQAYALRARERKEAR